MFGLIKMLVVIIVLFAAVFAGLAYLPDVKTSELGTQAAGLAAKGFRGGKAFYQSFRAKWEEEEATEDPSTSPEPGDASVPN